MKLDGVEITPHEYDRRYTLLDRVVVDPLVPPGTVEMRDGAGELIGKVTNIGVEAPVESKTMRKALLPPVPYYYHLRYKDKDGKVLGRGGVTVNVRWNVVDTWEVSWAVCSLQDNYSKWLGRVISEGRCEAGLWVGVPRFSPSNPLLDISSWLEGHGSIVDLATPKRLSELQSFCSAFKKLWRPTVRPIAPADL